MFILGWSGSEDDTKDWEGNERGWGHRVGAGPTCFSPPYVVWTTDIVAIYFQNTYNSIHRQYIHVPSVCIYYLCLDLEFMEFSQCRPGLSRKDETRGRVRLIPVRYRWDFGCPHHSGGTGGTLGAHTTVEVQVGLWVPIPQWRDMHIVSQVGAWKC